MINPFKKKKELTGPAGYWKERYNFDSEIEIRIYKDFCDDLKDYVVINQGKLLNRYSNWEKYVVNNYENKNKSELKEFLKYLTHKKRRVNDVDSLIHSLLIPLIISMLGSLLISPMYNWITAFVNLEISSPDFVSYIWVAYFLKFIVKLIPILVLGVIFSKALEAMLKMIIKAVDESLDTRSFYHDYIEIIKQLIE